MPGLIRECLNYEVGWVRGYTRIDGFERFDGQVSPSTTTGWVFDIDKANVTGTFTAPEGIDWGSGSDGVLVQIEDAGLYWRYFIVFRQGRKRPVHGDTVTGGVSGASFDVDDIETGSLETLPEYYDSHGEYLDGLDAIATLLRAEVKPVPGGGTIVGLHYHEDQLYAIRDTSNISVPDSETNKLIPGMYVYNDAGQVGEVVKVDQQLNRFHITAVDSDGFRVGAGDSIHVALTMRFEDGAGTLAKGSSMVGAVSGWAGDIGYIGRRDGSFESDNALGVVALINGPDGTPVEPPELFNDVLAAENAFTATAVQFPPLASATTVAVSHPQADVATIWKSTKAGWVAADSGRVLRFDTGTNDPNDETPVHSVRSAFPGLVEVASVTDDADWTGDIQTIKITDGTTTQAIPISTSPFTSVGYSDYLRVADFKIGMRDEEVITGLSATFVAREAPESVGDGTLVVTADTDSSGGRSVNPPRGTVLETLTVGGVGSQWTNAPHTAGQLNAASFGFRFAAKTSYDHAYLLVDSFQMTVHYTSTPGETLYLWDADAMADVGTIAVRETVVQTGDFVADDAAGYFRLKDWTLIDLPANTEVYTQPAAQGLFVANVVGDVSQPVLPGSALLDAENSRYQIISYNFYATEEKNAIYGVNGAGPAFWYDGETLDFILTGVDVDKDKPRHVAPHENRLALGYKWGEVYLSGPDPLDFSADTGLAASFGFGDKITGLMPAAGKALGVFTESTVSVLLGAPEAFGENALANVEQQTINHKVGAIEYTVQSIGNRPIFASFRGIETLETMDQYSDFFTAPLTYNVSPWLLERLQTAAGVEATDKSVVNSVVVRNKNQYRLFFADGHLLTLTHVGPEREPQNTTQKYWFESDPQKYSRCYATASGVTTDGRDRAFFSTELRPAAPDTVFVVGGALDYVYELDRGRSFDGGSIDYSFTLTHYYASDEDGRPGPQVSKRYNVFHFHGMGAGSADLRMARTLSYEDLDDPVLPYEDISLGDATAPPEDYQKPKYVKGRLSGRGFAVSVHVKGSSDKEFPHTLQMLTFLDDTITRPNR